MSPLRMKHVSADIYHIILCYIYVLIYMVSRKMFLVYFDMDFGQFEISFQ